MWQDEIERDELLKDAIKAVSSVRKASASILQRHLRVGYTRAARLLDLMEQRGLVGPFCGSKARDILVDLDEYLADFDRREESKRNTGEGGYNSGQDRQEHPKEEASLYSILGAREGASKEEIEKAYHKKILECHPDKLANLDPELKEHALRLSQKVNAAYEKLIKG